MNPIDDAPTALRQECEAFSRYLAGARPTEYVLARYRAGHGGIPYRADSRVHPLDVRLVDAGRQGGVSLQAADAYSRFFRPHGPLRQKMILLLAILESSPPAHEGLHSAARVPAIAGLAAVAGQVGLSLGCLALGVLRFGPLHARLRLRDRRGAGDRVPA